MIIAIAIHTEKNDNRTKDQRNHSGNSTPFHLSSGASSINILYTQRIRFVFKSAVCRLRAAFIANMTRWWLFHSCNRLNANAASKSCHQNNTFYNGKPGSQLILS